MCTVNLDMLWWRLLRWRNFRFSFVAYLPLQFWFSDILTFKMNFTFLIPISRFWTDRFGIDIFVWYFWQLCSAWSPSRDEDCFLHFLYKKRFYKIQDKMQEIRDNPIKNINKKRKKLIFWGYSVDDKFVKHASFRIRNQIFPYNLLLLTSFSVPCPLLGSSPVVIWPPRCHIHPHQDPCKREPATQMMGYLSCNGALDYGLTVVSASCKRSGQRILLYHPLLSRLSAFHALLSKEKWSLLVLPFLSTTRKLIMSYTRCLLPKPFQNFLSLITRDHLFCSFFFSPSCQIPSNFGCVQILGSKF